MDESRKLVDTNPAKIQSPKEDESPEPAVGATGVFSAIPTPSIEENPAPATEVLIDQNIGGKGRPFLPTSDTEPSTGRAFQEPIVHNVVLGGSASSPANLFETFRASPEAVESTNVPASFASQRSPRLDSSGGSPAPTPALNSGSKTGNGSEGLTQVFRALSGKSSESLRAEPSAPMQREFVGGDPAPAGTESGFTSLLQALKPEEKTNQVQTSPESCVPSEINPSPEGIGGFTALLQGFSKGGLEVPPTSTKSQKNEGGALTQLFRTLAPEAPSPAVPDSRLTRSDRAIIPPGDVMLPPPGRRPSEPSSFTEMISTIGESASVTPRGAQEHSILDDRSTDYSPASVSPKTAPDPQYGVPPIQPEDSSQSKGELTQLLQILKVSSKTEISASDHPPASDSPSPSNAEESLFTQTYKKLEEPAGPISLRSPAYNSSSVGDSFTKPTLSEGSGIDPRAGLGEFTQIRNMSKMREAQRQELSTPGALITPALLSQPLPSTPAMPQAPSPPSFHWPPQAPPTPVPGQPMQQAGAPQYTPPALLPQTPPPAPIPAAATPPIMGKMQQYLPLFAIIIIFLLVVILVTMVFLLRR